MEKGNDLIKLKDLDKRKDYAGIKFDIVIDDAITMKNVDIIVHKVVDCIDIFCFKRDQTKDVLGKLEKYKSKERGSYIEYKIPDISIDNNFYPVRIIMLVKEDFLTNET